MAIQLKFDKDLFQDLYPYIEDDDITDIRWNGRALWVESLSKGRYKTDTVLSDKFIRIFCDKIALHQDVNFNPSEPKLQASTPTLRLHCIHPSRTGDGTYIIAIRKTPAIARINDKTALDTHYADQFFIHLIDALINSRRKAIVIGDVGAGKTEFLKYCAHFIPNNAPTLTVEDTLEMKLPTLYPEKDIQAIFVDDKYPTEKVIRDALRLETRYLWLAEARGREITRIMEGASTGCTCWTTVHCEDTWQIPDRIVQMASRESDRDSFENDVFTFFDLGIKIAKKSTENGVHRRVDQVCFFDREDKKNNTIVFMKNGEYTGADFPQSFVDKFIESGYGNIIDEYKEIQKQIRQQKTRGNVSVTETKQKS